MSDTIGLLSEGPELPAANNMARSKVFEKDLSFKVSEEFHHAFKTAALAGKMTMKELLEDAFEAWLEKRKR